MKLESLGWNGFVKAGFSPYAQQGFTAARIIAQYEHLYRIATASGDRLASVAGRFTHLANERQDFPAVGDWVAVTPQVVEGNATIVALLPRWSKISRKVAGTTTEEQVLAANVDVVFLMTALNLDFNPRRIERYFTWVWDSGATPVVLLSKADLCADLEQKLAQVNAITLGSPVLAISSQTGEGIEEVAQYLNPNKTGVLLGSSGAGKSTLINRLVGREIQKVQTVRESDHRGRHTTTHRELIPLTGGGAIIDTPGLRELHLWANEDGLSRAFDDIEHYASQCYYMDCKHDSEPNCAVRQALEDGRLDAARFQNYLKLQKEAAYLMRKKDKRAQLAEKKRWKKIHQDIKKLKYRWPVYAGS